MTVSPLKVLRFVKNGVTSMLRKPEMLEVGAQAPDFTVKTHEGNEVRLSDYRGKKVLLWFYPKADTPGCTLEGKKLRDRHQEFVDRGVQVLGISYDEVADNCAFAEKFEFPFPLLCDDDFAVGNKYGAGDSGFASRISYLIDEQGVITHATAKVDPNTHADEILAYIK